MSNSFSSMAQFPATSPQPRAVGPQVYPPAQNNLQMRGYMQTSPRLQIGNLKVVDLSRKNLTRSNHYVLCNFRDSKRKRSNATAVFA